MEEKSNTYSITRERIKELINDIEAIKAFNYKQFKELSSISSVLLEDEDRDEKSDVVINSIREVLAFNFKQYKKLNKMYYYMMKTLDPKWEPRQYIIKKKGGERDAAK